MLLLCIVFRCCWTQFDPGRFDWWCRLHHIFTVIRVDLCRIHSAPDCIRIFRRSSRHIVQPPDVDDLRSLNFGLLQRDFRHFQFLNVRKLLDSPSVIQTDVQDVHPWLQSISCSNPQPAEYIHHYLRDLQPRRLSCTYPRPRQLRVDLACLPAHLDVCYWTGLQSPSPESLISSSAVSTNFPKLWPLPRCQPPARVHPQPALYHCLSFARGHCSTWVMFVLVSRLNLLCLTLQLHCPRCPVFVTPLRTHSCVSATRHATFLATILDLSFQSNVHSALYL